MIKRNLSLLAAVLLALGVGVNSASAATPPAPAPAGSTFEQRLIQRKAERAIVLSLQDTQRLVSACPNGQAAIRTLQITDVKALDNRAEVYDKIDAKLLIAIGQIKLAGKDTFHLEEQRQAYIKKLNDFEMLSASYKQAVDDILVINCKADPAGFKALLETGRIYNGQLKSQATDIRNYVVDTLKATIQDHADKLETNTGEQ